MFLFHQYRELIVIAQPTCGIKRLLGKIGRIPTTQSFYFDIDFKSEALNFLGYFLPKAKQNPAEDLLPNLDFTPKPKSKLKEEQKCPKNITLAVEVSDEIHEYLTTSDRQMRYCDEKRKEKKRKERKQSDWDIDMKKEKVTEISSREDSFERLTDVGKEFANITSDFREQVIKKKLCSIRLYQS